MSVVSDLIPAIRRNLGGRSDSDTEAMIINSLSLGQKIMAMTDIHSNLMKSITSTLTASTYIFTPNYGTDVLRKVKSILLTEIDGTRGQKLDYMSLDKWDALCYEYVTASGATRRPQAFTIGEADKIWFNIKSDKAYPILIRYFKWPAVLTTTASTLEIQNFDDALIMFGTAFTFLGLEEFESAKSWLIMSSEFLKGLNAEQLSKGHIEPIINSINVKSNYYLDPFVRKTP